MDARTRLYAIMEPYRAQSRLLEVIASSSTLSQSVWQLLTNPKVVGKLDCRSQSALCKYINKTALRLIATLDGFDDAVWSHVGCKVRMTHSGEDPLGAVIARERSQRTYSLLVRPIHVDPAAAWTRACRTTRAVNSRLRTASPITAVDAELARWCAIETHDAAHGFRIAAKFLLRSAADRGASS